MWGERAVAGFFEDVQVLIVVVLGVGILVASVVAAFVAHETARERAELQSQATRVLRILLEDPRLLHEGEGNLLDATALDSLTGALLLEILKDDVRVQFAVSERTGTDPTTTLVETGPLGPRRAIDSTAASVWHSDRDVRAAIASVALGG